MLCGHLDFGSAVTAHMTNSRAVSQFVFTLFKRQKLSQQIQYSASILSDIRSLDAFVARYVVHKKMELALEVNDFL